MGSATAIMYTAYVMFFGFNVSNIIRIYMFLFTAGLSLLINDNYDFFFEHLLQNYISIDYDYLNGLFSINIHKKLRYSIVLLALLTQLPIIRFVAMSPKWIEKLKNVGFKLFCNELIEYAHILVLSSILVVLHITGIYFAKYLPQFLISFVEYMVWVFLGLSFFYFIIFLLTNFYDNYKDGKTKKKTHITDRMPRTEIVNFLTGFKTERYRLKFVEMLAINKVIAVGEWPEGFSLSNRHDEAITQLARLEEKWLGLDR